MADVEAAVDALEKAFKQSLNFRTWLRARPWCGDTIGPKTELALKDRAPLAESPDEVVVFFLAVAREGSVSLPLHIPLAITREKPEPEAFALPADQDRFYVTDGEASDAFARFLVDAFRARLVVKTTGGDAIHFLGEDIGTFRSSAARAEGSSNLLVEVETSAGAAVFKSYKRLDVGNREPDVLDWLHRKRFPHVPKYRGEWSLGKGTDRLVLGIATERVDAKDAFAWLTEGWRAELGGANGSFEAESLEMIGTLGDATAALHDALLDRHAGPFQAEPFTREDADAAIRAALTNLSDSLRHLAVLSKGPDARLGALAADARLRVFEERDRIEGALSGLAACVGTAKGVTHADLHLGQILRTDSGALFFLDFEGEPERPPGQRSGKLPPLRDIATMNRSFSYVKHYAWREATKGDGTSAWRFLLPEGWSPAEESVAHRLAAWERTARERYVRQYLSRAAAYESTDVDTALRAIRGWAVEKAVYELRYELRHRPQNIFIPLEGVLSLSANP